MHNDDGGASRLYTGEILSSYSPVDADLQFEVIITDTSIGDGGDFYRVVDSFAEGGHYEVFVENAPAAAGVAYPSALKITLTTSNITIEKIIPIVIG
jgi:hypothetical protein